MTSSLKPQYSKSSNKPYHALYHVHQGQMFSEKINENNGFFVSFWKAHYYKEEADERFNYFCDDDENEEGPNMEEGSNMEEVNHYEESCWNTEVGDDYFIENSSSSEDEDDVNDWIN